MKTLFAFTVSVILVLFYAFFMQLFHALLLIISDYNYAVWAKVLLLLTNFALILIPLYLIFYTWQGYAASRPDYYKWVGRKVLHGFLAILIIAVVSYFWTNYYDRLF